MLLFITDNKIKLKEILHNIEENVPYPLCQRIEVCDNRRDSNASHTITYGKYIFFLFNCSYKYIFKDNLKKLSAANY